MTAAAVRAYLCRLDTITAALTIVAMALLTERSPWGWAVALANQGLWAVLVWRRELWGMVPLCAVLTVIYSRGLVHWFWP